MTTAEEQIVLVATVGTGRNREDVAAAIVFSLRHHKADRAVFLCSSKTHAETLPRIRQLLEWDEERYRDDICRNEEDVQQLFMEWNDRWEQWLADCPGARVIVDFTTGTKPMSAAAVLLAMARNVRTVSYVIGERDETGRVIRSNDVRTISPDLVLAHRQLRLAVDHFHEGSYAAARDLAAPFDAMPDDRLRSVALSIHVLAEAYEAWERFDYKAAANTFHGSRRHWPAWTWVDDHSRLEANDALIRQVRKGLKADEPTAPLTADLLANAERRMKHRDWDDAVARLYRACELLAQLRLWSRHDQKTDDVNPSKLPESLRAEYAERKDRSAGKKLKLGLYEAYELLGRLDDELGRKFLGLYRVDHKPAELKNLLDSRNKSLLAHGTVPIDRKKAEKLMDHVRDLAAIADPAILNEWLPKAEMVRLKAF